MFTGGPGAAGPGEQVLGGLLFLLLVAVWGAMPAAAFGMPALMLTHRLLGAQAPVWALVLAGMAAAGLYSACMLALAHAGQAWVFLPAPWTTGVLDAEQRGIHGLPPIVTAIVLSGAVGGLAYWRIAHRRQA